jgi:hypothetical protein
MWEYPSVADVWLNTMKSTHSTLDKDDFGSAANATPENN